MCIWHSKGQSQTQGNAVTTAFDSGSHVPQAGVEFRMYLKLMTLLPLLLSAVFIGTLYHTQLIWCWGSGHGASSESLVKSLTGTQTAVN